LAAQNHKNRSRVLIENIISGILFFFLAPVSQPFETEPFTDKLTNDVFTVILDFLPLKDINKFGVVSKTAHNISEYYLFVCKDEKNPRTIYIPGIIILRLLKNSLENATFNIQQLSSFKKLMIHTNHTIDMDLRPNFESLDAERKKIQKHTWDPFKFIYLRNFPANAIKSILQSCKTDLKITINIDNKSDEVLDVIGSMLPKIPNLKAITIPFNEDDCIDTTDLLFSDKKFLNLLEAISRCKNLEELSIKNLRVSLPISMAFFVITKNLFPQNLRILFISIKSNKTNKTTIRNTINNLLQGISHLFKKLEKLSLQVSPPISSKINTKPLPTSLEVNFVGFEIE
jgi:hypothetical protein